MIARLVSWCFRIVMKLPHSDEILLGELLRGAQDFAMVASVLSETDFSHPPHKKIWRAMANLYENRERIDRITVANELMKYNELESCGGLSYLVYLDDYDKHPYGVDL